MKDRSRKGIVVREYYNIRGGIVVHNILPKGSRASNQEDSDNMVDKHHQVVLLAGINEEEGEHAMKVPSQLQTVHKHHVSGHFPAHMYLEKQRQDQERLKNILHYFQLSQR